MSKARETAIAVVLVAFASRVAVAGIPPLLDHLGLSGAAQSLLMTVPVLLYAGGALLGPSLQRRFGPERAVFLSTSVLLAGLFVRAVWPEWALFPGTVIAGVAVAGLNVLIPSLVKVRFPRRAGDMTGAYTTSMVISTAAAAGLTIPVYHLTGNSLTAALGVWCLPVVVALMAWLPHLRLNSGLARTVAAPPLLGIWRDPLARRLTMFMACQWLLFYAPFSWLAEIYHARGLSDSDGGALLMLLNLTAIPTTLAVPILASRASDQVVSVSLVVSASAVGFLGILLAPASTAVIWVAIFGLAQGGALGLGMLLVILRAGDGNVAAQLSSMALSIAFLAAAAGILIMGLLHQLTGSWDLPLVFVIGVTFVSWPPGVAAAQNRTVGHRSPSGRPQSVAEVPRPGSVSGPAG